MRVYYTIRQAPFLTHQGFLPQTTGCLRYRLWSYIFKNIIVLFLLCCSLNVVFLRYCSQSHTVYDQRVACGEENLAFLPLPFHPCICNSRQLLQIKALSCEKLYIKACQQHKAKEECLLQYLAAQYDEKEKGGESEEEEVEDEEEREREGK